MARGGYKSVGGGDDGSMLFDDAAFELFAVAFLLCLYIPTLLYRLYSYIAASRAAPPTKIAQAESTWCPCSLCSKRSVAAAAAAAPAASRRRFANIAFVAVGFLLVAASLRVVARAVDDEPPFDPFAILGVSESATTREVKKAYRKKAALMHPDKNPGDDKAAERFIKLTKAHAALTDDDAKENYRKYGNPDGYIGTTLGVGMPSFVQENNVLLMLMYLFMLLAFPASVFAWWKKQSLLLPTSVTTDTFLLFRETISQTQKFRDLLGCVAGSHEFEPLFKEDNVVLFNEMTGRLRQAGKDDDLRQVKSVTKPKPFQVQNLILLNLYLARLDIPDDLKYVLEGLMSRVEVLCTALTDTVGAFQRPDCQKIWQGTYMHGHSVFLNTCISVSQSLIQGVDKTDSPLLQIPHVTGREVQFMVNSRTTPAKTVYEFMKLDIAAQRELLRDFTEEQFSDVQAFCQRYPVAMLTLDDPVVEDEEDGTVHAQDSVTVRGRLSVMRKKGSVYSPHTPNLPGKKSEVWWVSLSDQKLMCPVDVKRLLPKDAKGHDPDGKKTVIKGDSCCGGVSSCVDDEPSDAVELPDDPRVTVYDLKFQFTAPRPGTYTLDLAAAVDCYIGCNKSKSVKLVVKEPKEVDTTDQPRYFDTDDESDYDPEMETDSDDSDEERKGAETDPEDSEYEFIEVTDDENDSEEEEEAVVVKEQMIDPEELAKKNVDDLADYINGSDTNGNGNRNGNTTLRRRKR